jgi:pimeloyl-ACP methyl ester carboxylesterase
MSYVSGEDGVKLYYEERGAGSAIVFVHEFAGSCRSFDAQVEAFHARHRCVAFNARGYPPSDVPASVASYSQEKATNDIGALVERLALGRVHLVGVSMGAASVLQYALAQSLHVLSVTLVGIGTGSDDPAEFRAGAEANAKAIESGGMAAFAETMGKAPNRYRLKDKNPAEFARFLAQLSAMSALGHASTMRGVQGRRQPLYAHEKRIAALRMPAMVVVGDEDAGCRKPSAFLERALPGARLHVIPNTGHAVNLEEPAEFNRLCLNFVDEVDAARR